MPRAEAGLIEEQLRGNAQRIDDLERRLSGLEKLFSAKAGIRSCRRLSLEFLLVVSREQLRELFRAKSVRIRQRALATGQGF